MDKKNSFGSNKIMNILKCMLFTNSSKNVINRAQINKTILKNQSNIVASFLK